MYGIEATGFGMVRSTDGGESWSASTRGSLGAPPIAVAVSTLPGNSAGAFLAVLEDGGVYRATGGVDVWERVGDLAPAQVRTLVVGATADAGMWAATHLGVFHTIDAGATWSQIAGSFVARTVVPDPGASDVLYAASEKGVLRSIGGGPWRPIGDGLEGVDVRALAISGRPKRIVAGTIGRGAFRIDVEPCGDGVVDDGESAVAEVRCGLPDPAALSACVTSGKGVRRVRRLLPKLLQRAEKVLDRAVARSTRAEALVRRGRRLLDRLARATAEATRKGLLRPDCSGYDRGLERTARLLVFPQG
ncbi:MAG TPA: hypothetical protein VGR62_15115 [Candidatus Binatia bacterium]|jgi:hypothetical protein|nr:hypothetical protein [Candidatus Binatia bacterium]